MRAKAVNEIQNFERGKDPKESLGIGVFPKNPIPKFNMETEDLINNPQEIVFTKFNSDVFDMREAFIVMILKNALMDSYDLPIEVWKGDYENYEIRMTLSDEYSVSFTSSDSKGSWKAELIGKNEKPIDYTTSSTVFKTLPPKINKMLKKHKIIIGQ